MKFLTQNSLLPKMEKLQKFLFSLVFVLTFIGATSAQQGTIRGFVFDQNSGESLIAVTVALSGSTDGTFTEFDGSFELNVEPGIHTLEVSYVSYETVVISDVEVKAGEVTVLDNIQMTTESEMIDEIVITADIIRSSETALMTLKKKSAGLLDGISSSRFKKVGDSNASEAVKRVTGVSVEGGKYVFVRGLGDRYTKTMLNGLDIPGLDPDRNSLQIDIFPTTFLNNIMISKASLAELPADFTGGVVNIETKDFPEEKTLDVSFGLGYNPSMHLNDDYLYYEGGKTDWLGFDDGTRKLPAGADQAVIPGPFSGHREEDVASFLNDFSPTLGAQTKSAMPDFSLGISYGNQKVLKNDHSLGYTFSGTYKSSRRFYQDVVFGEYQNQTNLDQLLRANTISGSQGEQNILIGAMAGLAYKTANTTHSFNVLHLQNGNSLAAEYNLDNNEAADGQSGYLGFSDNLEYSQRGMTNGMIIGEYNLANDWTIDWRAAATLSTLTDPDIRKTAYSETVSRIQFVSGAAGFPSRIWRYLDEVNYTGKADFTRDYTLLGREAKLKFGFGHVYKQREFKILSYSMNFTDSNQLPWTGDASEVLQEGNIAPEGIIYYNSGSSVPNTNQFEANVNNTSVYVSNEFNPTPTLKAYVGLRAEKFVQRFTGRDQEYATSLSSGNNLVNAKVLDALDLFPSVNLIQNISEKQNLRLSYSGTIARPSFKELSFAQIIDPKSDRIFIGSLYPYSRETVVDGATRIDTTWGGSLVETRINNFDLRWEMFDTGGQLFSVSAFYKSFQDPIELVRITRSVTSNEFQPRNVGNGEVLGVELEIRRNIAIAENSLGLSTNLTLAHSSIDMSDTEYNSRLPFVREGETLDRTRAMAGQAPYILNMGATYNNIEKAYDVGLYYNVKGRTLESVGGLLFPDVYTKPFHSLNFSFNYSLGKEDNIKLSFNVDNILDSRRESVFGAEGVIYQPFTILSPRRSFGMSIGYSIF